MQRRVQGLPECWYRQLQNQKRHGAHENHTLRACVCNPGTLLSYTCCWPWTRPSASLSIGVDGGVLPSAGGRAGGQDWGMPTSRSIEPASLKGSRRGRTNSPRPSRTQGTSRLLPACSLARPPLYLLCYLISCLASCPARADEPPPLRHF